MQSDQKGRYQLEQLMLQTTFSAGKANLKCLWNCTVRKTSLLLVCFNKPYKDF